MSGISRNVNSTINYASKYPPRGAWRVMQTTPSNDIMHGGYTSEKLRKCPVCHRFPVFEEDAARRSPHGEKAKWFIGFCPSCELRTRDSGTLKEVVMQWQERKYSPDSWLHCHRPKLDRWGCALLCEAMSRDAYEEAMFYIDLMQKTTEDAEKFTSAKLALDDIESFFRTSPFASELDPDAVISKMRKELFPNATPEERIQIPLRMSKLYNGKEIIKKWREKQQSTKETNSLRRR